MVEYLQLFDYQLSWTRPTQESVSSVTNCRYDPPHNNHTTTQPRQNRQNSHSKGEQRGKDQKMEQNKNTTKKTKNKQR